MIAIRKSLLQFEPLLPIFKYTRHFTKWFSGKYNILCILLEIWKHVWSFKNLKWCWQLEIFCHLFQVAFNVELLGKLSKLKDFCPKGSFQEWWVPLAWIDLLGCSVTVICPWRRCHSKDWVPWQADECLMIQEVSIKLRKFH